MKWITANNLDQWADTNPARGVFPELIGDLIRASSSEIRSFRFPNGNKGQVRGFDGCLEAIGVPTYVPDGRSIWEFGVGSDAIAKVDADYTKRTNQVAHEERATSTFVFATPRTWDKTKSKIADWVLEKRNLNQWKSVDFIDGSMLEDWLSDHPAVASRYARYHLKSAPLQGASSTDEFWDEFSTRFEPPLVEEVLLAGREKQATSLLRQLSESGGRIQFAADSPDEVIAFAVAAIRKAEPEVRVFLENRTLVIESADAAKFFANKENLIFLPKGQARDLTGLLARSGPTIISAGADEKRNDHEVLVRPTSTALGKAFELMGKSPQEGYELARQSGRSLAVLARKIPSGTAVPPEWIQHSNELLPALLAGAWSAATEADKEVIKAIAGTETYEKFETPIRPLLKLKDAPLDRIDDVWSMRSSIDAFAHLAHLLGNEHLSRFAEAAKNVFSTIIPPPSPDDIYKPPAHRVSTHSKWLRDGMMTTMLHMAILHEQADFVVTGSSPQEYINSIIRSLPGLSSDYRLMASLNDQLPLLAEAAPIPFLEALERLLEGDSSAIKPIFDEQKGFLSSQTNHTGLLWALETLAWDPDYLLRSTICLARLASIDPGGSLTNRPINSLRDILLTWAPNTHANAKQRLGVIPHIVKTVPEISWQLICKLLPSYHDMTSGTAKPRLRDTEQKEPEVITYSLVWESQAAVVELALQLAGNDGDRWELLISGMSQFQLEQFRKTLTTLDKFLNTQAPEARYKVWNCLRKEVYRHRAFSNAEWSLRDEFLEQADQILLKYQPTDLLLLNSWLFDDWMPDIPGKGDITYDSMGEVEKLRQASLKNIYDSLGLKGIVQLSTQVQLPHLMAASIEKLALSKSQLKELLVLFMQVKTQTESLTNLCVADGFSKFGSEWLSDVQDLAKEMSLDKSQVAILLLGLPETRESWNLVSEFGADIEFEYWSMKHGFQISGDTSDLIFAVEKYLAAGRPMTAVEISHQRLSELESSLLLKFLTESTAEINQKKIANATMVSYYIEHIFAELEKRTDISSEEIARQEFAYLPVFSLRKKPLTLHRMLVESPDFFMSAICSIFKGENEDAPELTKEAEQHASAAYELLSSLNVIPGQQGEDVDFEVLKNWCLAVLELSISMNRQKVTESRIGGLLAHAPLSKKDNAWPHESVRAVIEILNSDKVENGIISERFNMRGVYSKSLGEGGQQERALAQQTKQWADVVSDSPRTTAMLRKISRTWDHAAERADLSAQKDALRW